MCLDQWVCLSMVVYLDSLFCLLGPSLRNLPLRALEAYLSAENSAGCTVVA